MFELVNLLFPTKLLALTLKPLVRIILGMIVAPLFRVTLHRVIKKELNEELEKDIAQWLRGSLLLLIATANTESFFFHWVPPQFREEHVWLLATRLLLAISVIEAMPDQALFSIIHPGPPKPNLDRRRIIGSTLEYIPKFLFGLVCQHLNRSSPVLAILAVFVEGRIGWVCYGFAIFNYLIIGLVSSKDKALDVLQQFDRVMAEKRQEIKEELPLEQEPALTAPQRLTVAEQASAFPPLMPVIATENEPQS
ncbi:MAG TPA: DNA topoisomerase I [Planctomycetaceae bacterium]|nr:DNA topoisomerase I [Planctomycetaceae bacterium]